MDELIKLGIIIEKLKEKYPDYSQLFTCSQLPIDLIKIEMKHEARMRSWDKIA